MPVLFEIKQLNNVQLALSLSIYISDSMLRGRNGHPFTIVFNGIIQSFLPI